MLWLYTWAVDLRRCDIIISYVFILVLVFKNRSVFKNIGESRHDMTICLQVTFHHDMTSTPGIQKSLSVSGFPCLTAVVEGTVCWWWNLCWHSRWRWCWWGCCCWLYSSSCPSLPRALISSRKPSGVIRCEPPEINAIIFVGQRLRTRLISNKSWNRF